MAIGVRQSRPESLAARLFFNKTFIFSFALAIAAVVIFHRLDDACLAGDDCYYSQVAKEMARSGDYLTPRNAGMVDFHTSKPPMLYWMNILSGKIFGFTTFAMRLPSAILGFLGVAALLFFVNKYFDPYTAFFSALILTFTQQYLYHARSAVTDGPFAVFFAFALFAFWMARSENKAWQYYLMGLAIGCAVMTRQLPGFFIYGVIAAYIVVAREFRLLKNPHLYGALLLSLAVILPWHLLMYRRYGEFFLTQYFGVALMTGIYGYPASYSGNPSLNPWYAYFSIIASNYEPWLLFLIAGVYQSVRRYASFDGETRKKILFVLLWCFVPLAIFQAAKVKQYHYITPLYIPFAIISARVPGRWREAARLRAVAVLGGLVLVLAVSCLAFPVIPQTLDSREFKDTILLVPAARQADGDIFALEDGFCHYASCLLFYADKKVCKSDEREIVEKMRAGTRACFVFSKENFGRIEKLVDARKVRILRSSERSVLVESGGNAVEEQD